MILRNSAKCNTCDVELVSEHRHDFKTHTCPNNPRPGLQWQGDKLVPSGKITFNFGVDGGKAYIRRIGDPGDFTDTSEFTDQESI